MPCRYQNLWYLFEGTREELPLIALLELPFNSDRCMYVIKHAFRTVQLEATSNPDTQYSRKLVKSPVCAVEHAIKDKIYAYPDPLRVSHINSSRHVFRMLFVLCASGKHRGKTGEIAEDACCQLPFDDWLSVLSLGKPASST